jgi:RHS repeat-associated protein
MQLASSARIPDGLLAAMRPGGEKPHQGLPSRNPGLHQGPTVCNSTTALGLQAAAVLNRVGSCSTGKERDTESGNDYFGARYYASTMGRFMSPDPLPWIHWQNGNRDAQQKFAAYIANPQNFNMYAYVNNNPLNKTDPTGMNACGTNNDSTCHVTITIKDRSTDSKGNYNDGFTGVKNQGNYNATATVSVTGTGADGKAFNASGTFLIKTTPSDSSSGASLSAGVYSGTLTEHNGHLAIRIQPTNDLPTNGANPGQHGAWFAQGDLIHQAGVGNFTGVGHDGRAVSNGCLVVCTSQYGDFENTTGMSASPPQRHFTVDVDTQANQLNVAQ